MVVIGRQEDATDGPVADVGTYRAVDGSEAEAVALDVDRPHAVSVVGKRGYGKSYTLGVLAEELARTDGVAPVVVDPMGAFAGLEADVETSDVQEVPARVVADPAVPASSLDPPSWCALLGLPPESGAGALVWQAATAADTLAGMVADVESADAPAADVRTAVNHLELAGTWGVFGPDGLTADALNTDAVAVLDVSALDPAPMNAVVRAVGETLYSARLAGDVGRLPWLLVDEAHTFFDGVADDGLRRILTRGRTPGVSLVLATQRPNDVPAVALSQSDVLVAHRLTSGEDRATLREARPETSEAVLVERLPDTPGEAVLVDDTTESVHAVRIRRRHTPHTGASVTVSSP